MEVRGVTMGKYKIFVDGSSGTTGLRIADLLAERDEFEILKISEADRKDVRARAAVLSDNVRRWGIGNVVVTSADPARFAPFGHYFDLILVDAPCSGEGMFRKDRESRRQWSESGAELCAARQRRILGEAWDALRP